MKFLIESKSNKIFCFVLGAGGGGGGGGEFFFFAGVTGARISELFLQRILIKKIFLGGRGGGGGGGRGMLELMIFFWGGGDRWTDRPKPICQSSSSRTTTVQNYFEIHALMYILWPGQAQYMTTLTII